MVNFRKTVKQNGIGISRLWLVIFSLTC